MDIRLRPIKASEFDAYQAYFVQDYAQEIMDNYGHSNLVAIEMAKTAIKTSFPEGITEHNDALFCIDLINDELIESDSAINALSNEAREEDKTLATDDDKAKLAGYLWRIINDEDSSCFISDFYVLPSMRSKGLGRLALTALEGELKAKGISQIKLRVAYQNQRAVRLYQDVGFTITGINMSKLLN